MLPPSLPDGALAAGAAARHVLFPSEDESTGIVSMAWRGPPYAAHGTWLMLRLLWKYLTDSAASPLQKVRLRLRLRLRLRARVRIRVRVRA